jgi:rhomboid family protein
LIPLRDSVPHRRAPVVTVAIIVASALAFLWELSFSEKGQSRLILRAGVIPEYTARVFRTPEVLLEDPFGAVRFWVLPYFTALFLHGGWLHLIGNMWFLWVFGDNVEDRLGRVRFLLFYLACGVAASALHVAFNLDSAVPTIGASGAIAGVLGAYVLLYPRARVLTLIPIFILITTAWIPAYVFLGIWFLFQWWGAQRSLFLFGEAGGVAYWAHIGGFLAGMALLLLFAPRRPPATYEVR